MVTPEDDTGPAALFDVAELAEDGRSGRAEAGLRAALAAAARDGVLIDLDAGMVAGALVGARALDRAERLDVKASVYAVAQCLPPYMKALHALRLPAEVAPVGEPPARSGAGAGATTTQSLGDLFGPS